ncbi:protein abrupt-like [Cylas formicarius]|uniref:protein abrupt-like n=1 Tax=Cylas formicarius TaxID=197179 RepID=UPI0029588B69|nr:protein abrupt-like [Cylas formicarius]
MTSKHFCLKWTKFQASILNAFESLQNTEDLADVTLSCEGISIKAHKFILSACSPYFRSIFKENPCSHPIVILKDVSYIDLIAIVNFMYHGEVMISEEQLPSFLQTAMVLQVSGLINSENPYTVKRHPESAKTKVSNIEIPGGESCSKKVKLGPKGVKNNLPEANFRKRSIPMHFDIVSNEKSKIENTEATSDKLEHNKDGATELDPKSETQTQGSILEAALEVKSGSILERSLTSAAAKPTFSCEKPGLISVLPETQKPIFIPGKSLIIENDMLKMRSSSESSSSPSTFDRTAEFLHPAIKIEEPNEMEMDKELMAPDDVVDFSKSIEVPHHSSQCGNCPHCGKIYSNQSALKYHVRLMHSDLTNMYCCHLCPESFDYREGYKKHMADAHSIRN